ncbi:MAG: class I SAM-dependent methyltransferase [Azospirillaceae bacterium]
MSFAEDWLSLRERFDRAARSPLLIDRLAQRQWSPDGITVVDLGAGTGQLMHHLAPRLPARQTWRLLDGDRSLLAAAAARTPPRPVAHVETLQADLAPADLGELCADADLVVTTAFLDLVSAAWLDRLARALARRRIPFYAALSVDGRQRWSPPDPLDEAIEAAFAADQRRDKGFGPALGVAAPDAAAAAFRGQGYEVLDARSDWHVDTAEQAMLQSCLAFQAEVARHVGVAGCRDWLARRTDQIEGGRASLVVGHRDLLALPRPTPS